MEEIISYRKSFSMEFVSSGQLKDQLLNDMSLDFVDEDLSLAVVGFGKMGLLHSSILNLLKPGIVKFIVDNSRVVTIGGSMLVKDVKFFSNLEKLLREDVDAVYITAPTQAHYSIAERILEAGIGALFIEKPPTVNLEDFMRLLGMARKCVSMIGFQKRYALPFRHAKKLLENSVIGGVMGVKCYIKSGDVLQPTKRFDSLGRGVLLDLGIHLLDLLCWYFGDMEIENAMLESMLSGVDDIFRARFSAGNFEVEFEASWCDEGFRLPETFIEIKGDRGILRVSEDYVKVELEKYNPAIGGKSLALYKPHYYQSFPPVLVADPEYTIEDMQFLSCLTRGTRPETSIESCGTPMKLLEGLYRRAHHG
jgi:predicted dehydrogenase